MTRRRAGKAAEKSAKDRDRGSGELPAHDPVWHQSRWRSELRRRLLDWFADQARVLPWRSDPQPYRVWVSEIMLQQTQVSTVLPYYERWMRAFPSVADLAAADESNVMRHWEGLGYYRRVRSMHAAAQQIMRQHEGQFPLEYEHVLALPGVGRYTAGAILSIATGARLPILEGNTQRVYSRWIALRKPPSDPAANRLLWTFAEKILPRRDCGTFNQAAMELGALVCTPKNPDCHRCPVRSQCRAARGELQAEIPGKVKSLDYQQRTEFALVLQRYAADRKRPGERAFLMRPLPDGARWAGLWDFPRPTEREMSSVDDAAQWLSQQLGDDVQPGARVRSIRHAVTRYRIVLHVHQASFADDVPRSKRKLPEPWRWVSAAEMRELAMSVTARKIATFLATDCQPTLEMKP